MRTARRPSVAVRLVLGVAVPLLLATGVGACSSSSGAKAAPASTPASSSGAGGPSPSTPSSTAVTIVIDNFAFSPTHATVKPGETITVKNEDSSTHTVTGVGSARGMFDTGDVLPGQAKTITAPTKPGSYPYDCSIHTFMTGTLTVS